MLGDKAHVPAFRAVSLPLATRQEYSGMATSPV
jgi:hypothetical protein